LALGAGGSLIGTIYIIEVNQGLPSIETIPSTYRSASKCAAA